MTTHSYRPLQGDTLLFVRDFPEVLNMIRSIGPRASVLCAPHELAAIRPHVRGTRKTTECPPTPPAVGSSTTGSSRPVWPIIGPCRRIRRGPDRLRKNVICYQLKFVSDNMTIVFPKGGFFQRLSRPDIFFSRHALCRRRERLGPKTGCFVSPLIDKRYQRHYATPAARLPHSPCREEQGLEIAW